MNPAVFESLLSGDDALVNERWLAANLPDASPDRAHYTVAMMQAQTAVREAMSDLAEAMSDLVR